MHTVNNKKLEKQHNLVNNDTFKANVLLSFKILCYNGEFYFQKAQINKIKGKLASN